MNPAVVQLQTTLPDEAAARRLATRLVEDRLAACVQIVGPVDSTYRWQDAVEHAAEWLCLIKSTAECAEALIAAIRALHPYQVPEILVLPVLGGNEAYLDWVTRGVRDGGTKHGAA